MGEPDLLAELTERAGLTIHRIDTWVGATTLGSIDTFLDVELLPIADRIDQPTRAAIIADSRTVLAPFVDPTGAIAAPIEVQLLTARRR